MTTTTNTVVGPQRHKKGVDEWTELEIFFGKFFFFSYFFNY